MPTKDSKDYSAQVARLKTAAECRGWIKNAKRLKLESAESAGWLRLGQLLALQNVPAAASDLDVKIDAAIRLIDERRGTRSNYTWRKIKQVGYVQTVEDTVTKPTESQGFRDAIRAGLASSTFEQIVCDHPEHFSPEALAVARSRLVALKKGA
ncbi:MAG: hypothetical protein ACLPV8_01775 [Steroidobacteraceae bacterium]